jgi:apolipoprotein N-acyltransferase
MARYNMDVIIGCSHQRSDTHEALKIMSQFLAYNTNAYVLRSSVSMDETANICGASMVVAPDGEVLGEQGALTTGLVVADVYARSHQTLYQKVGYLLVWLCFAAQIALISSQIAFAISKRDKRHKKA